ncbi:MAG: DUF4304 domain-containing protein [Polyangiaceae bacterium]
MTPLEDTLSLLRLSTLRAVVRSGDTARLTFAYHTSIVVVALEGVLELALEPTPSGAGEAAPITDADTLTSLSLQLLHQTVQSPVAADDERRFFVWVRAWHRGAAIRGGRLRVRASRVSVFDTHGAHLSHEALAERARAHVRVPAQPPSRMFDSAVRKLKPMLADAGFKSSGRSFLRARGGLVDTITFEGSRFTTNVSALYSTQYGIAVGELPAGVKLDAAGVQANTSPAIKHLFEPPIDLAGCADADAVAGALKDDLELVVLPYLASLPSPDAVIEHLLAEDARHANHANALRLACILARLGRADAARAQFLLAEGDRDAIARVAASMGITL